MSGLALSEGKRVASDRYDRVDRFWRRRQDAVGRSTVDPLAAVAVAATDHFTKKLGSHACLPSKVVASKCPSVGDFARGGRPGRGAGQ
jgi:hypothetical protein